MGTRRKSRELAMQMLFQGDLGKQKPEEVARLFWPSRDDVDAETRGFAEDIYRDRHDAAGGDRSADRGACAELAAWSGWLRWTAI